MVWGVLKVDLWAVLAGGRGRYQATELRHVLGARWCAGGHGHTGHPAVQDPTTNPFWRPVLEAGVAETMIVATKVVENEIGG